MDIEKLRKILRKNNVPDYYGIYIDCKGYSPTAFYYIYCDKKINVLFYVIYLIQIMGI